MNHAQRGTHSVVIASQSMTNSATVTGNLDCRGADYATLLIALGTEVNTNAIGPTISVLTDNTTTASNFATITADRSAEDITAAKVLAYHVDMRGQERYLRVSVTSETTTNDDVELSVIGVLTRSGEEPASTTGMADVAVIV